MTVVTMTLEALVFLVATVSLFTVVGFGPIVLLGPDEPGAALLLGPVVGLAGLYLACQWLSPFLASSVIVIGTVGIGAVVSVVAAIRIGPALRPTLTTMARMFIVPGALSIVTYLALLTHLFKLQLFTLAGTGFDALFVYAPVAEFMRRHPYTTTGRPALDVPALPTLVANFYPGSLGTVDGGLGALIRRPAFALIEPLNAVCVVLALLGVYVLVRVALGCSRRTAALAVLLMAGNQFVFWTGGFDFVQQFRASALLPGALALLLMALRTRRIRTGLLAGGVIAASVAIYMPVFLVVVAASGAAVIAYLIAATIRRDWAGPSKVVLAIAVAGLGLGLPSVRWLLFGGGIHAWDLVSRNLFSPYPAGGLLDRPYGLPYLTGSASVAYLYRIVPSLFWGPNWDGAAHVVAYIVIALAALGLVGLIRSGRWPEAALFTSALAYLVYVRVGPGNLYGFVKTTSYLVPLTSSLVALGAAELYRCSAPIARGFALRAPALITGVAISLVLAAEVAAAVETQHLFLQLPPTISRAQTSVRAIPAQMTGKGAVLIQDFSPVVPGLPLYTNSALDHVVAYFITDRDVTVTGPDLTPELAGRFRFLVRTGVAPEPPPQYSLLWRNAALGVSLYSRG